MLGRVIQTVDTVGDQRTKRLKIFKTRVIYLKLVTIVFIYNSEKAKKCSQICDKMKKLT